MWKELKLEKLIIIETYTNVLQYVKNTVLFPVKQAKNINKELNGYRIRDVYCPMITGWTHLISKLFKDSRKSLVIHDPILHPGEKIKYARFKQKYGKYDVLFVHSRKYVDYVNKMYGKPTFYFRLGRHNYYKNCDNKTTIVIYNPDKINYLFFKINLKQIFNLSFHISANGDKSWILRLFRHLSYREILGISLCFSA